MIAGSGTKVGFVGGYSPGTDTADVVFGYENVKLAVVPLTNNETAIQSKIIEYDENGKITKITTDAVSLLVQFGVKAGANVEGEGPSIGMSDSIATGPAARK